MPVFHEGKRQEPVRDKMKAAKFTFPGQTDGETIIAALIEHFGIETLQIRLAEAVEAAAPDIKVLAKKPAKAGQKAKEEKSKK